MWIAFFAFFFVTSAHALPTDLRIYAPDKSGAFLRVSVIKDTVYFEKCVSNTPQCDPIGVKAGYSLEAYENLTSYLSEREQDLTKLAIWQKEQKDLSLGYCTAIVTTTIECITKEWALAVPLGQFFADILESKSYRYLGRPESRVFRELRDVMQARRALEVLNSLNPAISELIAYENFIEGLRKMTAQMDDQRCQSFLQ